MSEQHERIPPTLREKIEDHLGELQFSQARINELGTYAVVQDKVFHNYSALRINKEDEGFSIAIKPGFTTLEEAKQFVKEAHIQDIVQHHDLLPHLHHASELKIISEKNGNAYYIGRELNGEPYIYLSDRYDTLADANKALDVAKQFEKDIDGISKGNLRVLLKSFDEHKWIDDPDMELKRQLMKEQYMNRLEKEKEQKEMTR